MATKIYIVTSGCYSDYSIEAVFLDKKKARRFVAIHRMIQGRNADLNFHEYEEGVIPKWSLGAYVACERDESARARGLGDLRVFCTMPAEERDRQPEKEYVDDGSWSMRFYASSLAQAKKIAQDRYAQWKYKTKVEEASS